MKDDYYHFSNNTEKTDLEYFLMQKNAYQIKEWFNKEFKSVFYKRKTKLKVIITNAVEDRAFYVSLSNDQIREQGK